MPNFQFKAHDRRSDKEIKDTVEAANQSEAIAAIKKQGYLPIEVKEVKGRSAASPAAKKKKGGGLNISIGGVKTKNVCDFTRQLSTLIDAGLPIVQSLQILTDMQKPGPLKGALEQVTEEVQSGTMLSEAFSHHPKIWNSLYTNLVRAGETAGALEAILRRLADFQEKAQALKRKVIGALVYPIAVMTIAVGILTFIMIVIVPKFQEIFEEIGIDLPDVTNVLIGISDFVGSSWYIILIAIFALIILVKVVRRTETGGAIIDRVFLRIPVIGNVVRKSAVARFTRTLGTLVTSGVGFLDALDITKAATPNIVVRNTIQDVRESVKEGETINEPLARSGVFNDIVVNMIKVGEETGELDTMLAKIADNYETEVDEAVEAMMSLMEPALLVFMGLAVGFIVIALFMPLIEIINEIG